MLISMSGFAGFCSAGRDIWARERSANSLHGEWPSRRGGHAQPASCANRRVCREKFLLSRRAACGALEASLQPSSTKTSDRCLSANAHLYCSGTVIGKSATTGLGLALTDRARDPASSSAQVKNFAVFVLWRLHMYVTLLAPSCVRSSMGGLLHGHRSSPLGFIRAETWPLKTMCCACERSLVVLLPIFSLLSRSLLR
jgi:hypothetical protein